MTPSAMTAAGRSTAAPRPVQAPGVPGHRRTGRPPQGPRGPRRVSGPARGGRAAPALAPRRPSLAARGLLVIRGLPEHTLLDRIVRGRAWIPLLGVLLAGLVAMQVEILKLGTGMGRWIDRGSTLATRNQALQASVAGLMDDQRIERLAAKMGMVMPDPTAVSFLSAHPGADAGQAAARIHAPDPAAFASQPTGIATATSSITDTGGGSSQPLDTSQSASVAAAASGGTSTSSGTSAASQPSTGSAPGGAASSAQPVDAGGAGASAGTTQQSGSGGAASIAPPSSSQSSGASGG